MAMVDEQSDILQKTFENLNNLKCTIPQAMHSFSDLSKAALQEGKFDKRMKEIIALAISIAVYSKGCMKFHLKSLIIQQLSQDELIEIIAIITYISGGSGLMSALKALKYFEEMQQTKDFSKPIKNGVGDDASNKNTSFRDNITKGYD
jgi:alkylhydroperoxidase/carboxymuconolactone decarboxylase family protein YurZ